MAEPNAAPEYESLELLIDGTWRQGGAGASEPVFNPATGEVLGHLPHADTGDLDAALEASRKGFEVWRRMPLMERQAILHRAVDLMYERKEAMARTLTLEMGKPLDESRVEIDFGAETMRWYIEEARRAYGRIIPGRVAGIRPQVFKEPVGPSVAFVAWNFPATNVLRKLSGALAAGCSIIVKPSEETPGTAVALGRCFQDAGLPPGVLNIVFGVPDHISRHLLASPIPRKVSVTGSTAVGKHLVKLSADTMKRCTMELGGHAPVIVAGDADFDSAVAGLIAGKVRNAGQVCTSPTRFLIDRSIYADFVDAFAEGFAATRVGNGLDPESKMGPLLAERRVEWMETLIADAEAKGGRVVTGGNRIGNVGHFFQPTVIADAHAEMRAMNEEPFGPFVLMKPVADVDEALAEANRLEVGLAGYGFTRSQATALKIHSELECGVIGINQPGVSLPEAPFGGVNETGYGSEGGVEGLETFLRTKFVNEMVL